jgi:hypothetical protein
LTGGMVGLVAQPQTISEITNSTPMDLIGPTSRSN